MPKRIRLLHSVARSNLDTVLTYGLHTESNFPDLDLDIRKEVVFCWLRAEDDKLHWDDHVYVEVEVEKARCMVADMDLISMAMMYLQGQRRRVNPEAAHHIAAVYRLTAVPLEEYEEGMFDAPEVLVKGAICPEEIVGEHQ